MRNVYWLSIGLFVAVILSADMVLAQRGGFGRGRGPRNAPEQNRGPAEVAEISSATLRTLPMMQALDTNGDGELSPKEIANASAALKSLDKDANGTLTASELLPVRRGIGLGQGQGRGPGRGLGPQGGPAAGARGRGPGAGAGMGTDMSTIHAMFAQREKIKRTIKNLPDGAEALTESNDKELAALIQEHVPNMDGRVLGNEPLPPMTFHPVFVELIKNADKYTLEYEDTDKGVKTRYQSDDPYVVMLVQEHAKLVSRFIKNGMEEIHKPYTLPDVPKPVDSGEGKGN